MSDDQDPRDHMLSRLYREGAWPEPSRQIDQAIVAASRRASRERHPFLWRLAPSFAIAATVVLTSAIVLKVYREQPAVVATSTQDKPAAVLRAKSSPEPKEAEQKPAETQPAAPPAPEPQAAETPQGYTSTMDAFEALRLERAQRDLGLKELQPAGAQQAAKAAPLARPTSQALKKDSPEPPAANRERRADTTPSGPTLSVFGASPPPTPAQVAPPAPAQATRAATGKPSQLSTESAPQAAARAEAPQAAPRAEATQTAPSAEAAQAPQAEAQASPSGSASIAALQMAPVAKAERAPQAWIDDIRKLMKEGKSEEAGEEIAKFKKRYPDYVLPDDLR
jgi:hypothetical protein